mgnify:CR=1 FL=1
MKVNLFLSLIEHACSDQVLLALPYTDHFLIITITSVRYMFCHDIFILSTLIHSFCSPVIDKALSFQALFPSDDWWVVPAKVVFDQTFWSAVWNSIYYAVVGALRLESPASIFGELKATFWPMLTVR